MICKRVRRSKLLGRLEEITGIGPNIATALVAEVGDWEPSRPDAIWRPGLGWFPSSIRPEAETDLAESQSNAIDICDGCWSLEPWRSSAMPDGTGTKRAWLVRLMERRPPQSCCRRTCQQNGLGRDGAR
jgi:hypothetical protein